MASGAGRRYRNRGQFQIPDLKFQTQEAESIARLALHAVAGQFFRSLESNVRPLERIQPLEPRKESRGIRRNRRGSSGGNVECGADSYNRWRR